jgi:hypothetical protein
MFISDIFEGIKMYIVLASEEHLMRPKDGAERRLKHVAENN